MGVTDLLMAFLCIGIYAQVGVMPKKDVTLRQAAVPHMPFVRKALDATVKKKLASGQPPPFYEDGYQEWKDAYVQKRAGVCVASIACAVSVAEKTSQKGIGCE
jgi:hypothetical protein